MSWLLNKEEELSIAKDLIDAIEKTECLMLMYEAEKEVVKKALRLYIERGEKEMNVS